MSEEKKAADLPPPETMLQPGDIYKKKYEKNEELGRGKFGVVFQVKDKENGKCYAAKHIRVRKTEHKDKVLEEIALLKCLTNPHIIRFMDAFENPGEIILVTEYLDGGELFEKVATEDFNLTESDCCLFMRQIIRGVEYLHNRNVVHLDLKPENVVCVNKHCSNIKIIDFGTARALKPGEKVMCGTPEFVAPEIVSFDNISPGTDMWSVGVICYILLSGFSPFLGESDSETFSNIAKVVYDFDEPEFDIISTNAKDFITSLLMKNPRNRMSAKECLDHAWLLEKDIGETVIDTTNLKKFVARRRWQRCGQAIRAMKRMSGLMLKRRNSGDPNSLSRRGSSASVTSSPSISRRNSEDFDDSPSNSPKEPASPIGSPMVPKLNLLEEKLRGEIGPGGVVLRKLASEDEICSNRVENIVEGSSKSKVDR